MRIRRIEAEEWRSLRDLRLRALLDTPDAFGSTYATESVEDEAGWRSWVTGWEPGFQQAVFVAIGADRWIGMAMGAAFPKEPGLAHLFAMWVDPESRRRGAGFALVEAVLNWARETAAEAVILGVTQSNEDAVRFYTRCGFVGTADPPSPLREGSSLMTQRMRIHLGDVTDDEPRGDQVVKP